jgi:hypothetical protein
MPNYIVSIDWCMKSEPKKKRDWNRETVNVVAKTAKKAAAAAIAFSKKNEPKGFDKTIHRLAQVVEGALVDVVAK